MYVIRVGAIKSMDDAKRFIDKFGGTLYINAGNIDLCLERTDKHGFFISSRPVSARGNVFYPYVQLNMDATKGVYKYRKYINRLTNPRD